MSSADLEERIRGARDMWPGVDVDDAEMRRWVNARLEEGVTLDQLRVEEIYLACACAAGNVRALVHFRDRFKPAIAHAIGKAVPRSQVEDAVQRVFVKLFVGSAERQPAITTFGGRGKLSTWLQVVARREASNAQRSERASERPQGDDLDELKAISVAGASMPELRQEYRAAFKGSFHHALASLTPRERNLLRYECVDGLTIDEIARIYRVSRSTIARWRAACRDRLFELTRQAFNDELGIVDEEFGSVVKLIESQLNVSLKRVLHESESDDETRVPE